MPMKPLDQKLDVVQLFKYLEEIIMHNLNEKATWINRTNKMKKAQFLTLSTYNKKFLSIDIKIQYYKTVTLPEATYGCEMLFQVKNGRRTDQLLKTPG